MRTISDVMTPNPTTVSEDNTILEAARAMRERDIGDVIATKEDKVFGILTDRDIVIRVLAEGRSPEETTVGEVATTDPVTLAPEDDVDEAVARMRDKAIRRLPVCDENGKPVGVVSIGDLAEQRDSDSALADISEAPPNK